MTETLHYTCESIGNIVRLAVTIRFETLKSSRDIAVFHQRFDNEPDDIFADFLETLYPDGCTIGQKVIDVLTEHIYGFLQKDEQAKEFYACFDKRHCSSYVYFRPDKTVYVANTGEHANLVVSICSDYFKDFSEIDPDYLKKFILGNFEIKSDFTSVEQVSRDAPFIAQRCGLL